MTDKQFYGNQDSENKTNKKSKLLLSYPSANFSYKGSNIATAKTSVNKKVEPNIVETKIEENLSQTEIPFEYQSELKKELQVKEEVQQEQKKVEEKEVITSESVEPLFVQEQKKIEKPIINATGTERVIPTKPKESVISLFKKYSRLLLVLLIILFLFFMFWLLKPEKPKVMESLENKQVNELPLEFRPIDEEEAKRAEELRQQELAKKELEAKKAFEAKKETEAKKHQELDKKVLELSQPSNNTGLNNKLDSSNKVKPTQEKVLTEKLANNTDSKVKIASSEAVNPVIVKEVDSKNKLKTEAKKQTKKIEEKTKTENVKTKYLVIKEGVSLMQLFRDNKLNLSDINRMTHAKGANNVFRHLNGGDKVMLYLNKQGHVAKMVVKNGKFIRQPNGQYIFKK